MDTQKLKPWNWFKHEENSQAQVPVRSARHSPLSKGGSRQFHADIFGTSPLMQLHQEMDRLFDDTWRSYGASPPLFETRPRTRHEGLGLLASKVDLDISGSENEYTISVDLPGLTESDVNLEVVGNTLKIEGHKEDVAQSQDKHFYCTERSSGSFMRNLALPDDADTSDITARMKHGVLEIHLPRRAMPNAEVKKVSISEK